MKKPRITDIYKSIRKPTPRPTKVEKDKRKELRDRQHEREIDEEYGRRRKPSEQED